MFPNIWVFDSMFFTIYPDALYCVDKGQTRHREEKKLRSREPRASEGALSGDGGRKGGIKAKRQKP